MTSLRTDEELTETTPQLEAHIRSRIRRFFSAKRLYECLQPLLFFTYWHGLTPFYVTSHTNGVKYLKLSIWGYINVGIHIVVYSICYIVTLTNDCETVAGYFFRSRISHFGDFLQILSGFIGVTVIYLTAIIPKHYVQKSLTIMHTMDERLQGVGIKIMYSKVLRFSYIYILFMVIVNLGYTILSLQLLKSANVQPSASLHVTFVLQHTVVVFELALYSCFTKMIEMRLNMMHSVSKIHFYYKFKQNKQAAKLFLYFIFTKSHFGELPRRKTCFQGHIEQMCYLLTSKARNKCHLI